MWRSVLDTSATLQLELTIASAALQLELTIVSAALQLELNTNVTSSDRQVVSRSEHGWWRSVLDTSAALQLELTIASAALQLELTIL